MEMEMTLPRVNISGRGCSIDSEEMAAIKKGAARLVGFGTKHGFGDFPIDRGALRHETVDYFFTENRICRALTANSGATQANHDDIRDEYKAKRMTAAEAAQMGVIARHLPLTKVCPPDYDWCDSMVYNDVDDCHEVTEEIDGYGMPTVMYSVEEESVQAQRYVDRLSTATLYTKYANGGPMACGASRDETGRRFFDSFHSLAVLFTKIDFVMRSFAGRGWTAWTMRRSCDTPLGETYAADDLMFNFGMRIFVPIEVERDGELKDRTLVMTTSAVNSSVSTRTRLSQ